MIISARSARPPCVCELFRGRQELLRAYDIYSARVTHIVGYCVRTTWCYALYWDTVESLATSLFFSHVSFSRIPVSYCRRDPLTPAMMPGADVTPRQRPRKPVVCREHHSHSAQGLRDEQHRLHSGESP